MNPDDVVLVALVNTPRDYELIRQDCYYRMPARHAPRYFSGAQYVAFYLPAAFGERRWRIDSYATARGHELVRRRDLLPDEADHPRADEPYIKLQLGPLQRREPPIISKRPRRILYLWTTWDKFMHARQLNDLYSRSPAHERLWQALRDDDMSVERELIVREGRSRYRVDFMFYLARGRLAVNLGEGPFSRRRTGSLVTLGVPASALDSDFDSTLEKIRRAAKQLDR
jgi:hypothetical protein